MGPPDQAAQAIPGSARSPLAPRRTVTRKSEAKSNTCDCAGCPARAAFPGSENRFSGASTSSRSTIALSSDKARFPRPTRKAEHSDYDADTSDPESIARSFEAHTWRTAAFEAQAREDAAAERVTVLAAALAKAEEERDKAEAAGRALLSSLAAVVREKEALEERLKAEKARAEDATAAAKSIAKAGDAAIVQMRGEVERAVAKYGAEMAQVQAEASQMRELLSRLTALAEEGEKTEEKGERLTRAFSTMRRRKKHPLESLAADGELPPAVGMALLIGEKTRLLEELKSVKKERDAAMAHARGAEESEGLRALEAVGEVVRATRSRVQVCADCRPSVLDAVAGAEAEVRRKYERGVVQR